MEMHRFPASKLRRVEIAVLGLIVAAHVTVVTTHYVHGRKAAQLTAILNDPLTTAITPSQFGLEVASGGPERLGDDQWKAFCYRARAALVESARVASAETARD